MTTPTNTYGYVEGHQDDPDYIVYTDKDATTPIIARNPYGAVEYDNAYDFDGSPIPTYLKDGTPYLGMIVTYTGKRMRDPIDSFPGYEPPAPPSLGAEDMPTVDDLKAFSPEDVTDDEQAQIMLESALALVASYTRDRHAYRDGKLRPGVRAVILSAAARMIANPSGISRSDQAGSFSTRRGPGFSGFTLAERAVLNRYRKRAAG